MSMRLQRQCRAPHIERVQATGAHPLDATAASSAFSSSFCIAIRLLQLRLRLGGRQRRQQWNAQLLRQLALQSLRRLQTNTGNPITRIQTDLSVAAAVCALLAPGRLSRSRSPLGPARGRGGTAGRRRGCGGSCGRRAWRDGSRRGSRGTCSERSAVAAAAVPCQPVEGEAARSGGWRWGEGRFRGTLCAKPT